MIKINYRPSKPEDYKFIISSFVQSYRKYTTLHTDQYYKTYIYLFETVVNKNNLHYLIAETDDVIVGWSALSPDMLGYVYVKHLYRGCGIGSKLIEGFDGGIALFYNGCVDYLLKANKKDNVRYIF